jgi:hypothetical protein
MGTMDWIALKHALLSHLPVATGLLLAWPLLAAQRPGRGIRPWWTVARYLGWTGIIGTVGAFVSGFAAGRALDLIPVHRFFPVAASGWGPDALLFRHTVLGVSSLLVGVAAIWSMNRARRDHESLGLVTLALGLAWSVVLLLTGEGGYRLAHGRVPRGAVAVPAPALVPALAPAPIVPPQAERDPEAKTPVRALDYASLEAIHPDPVKSTAHGNRWIRAWASPEAAAAYRTGQPLPQGAQVVLSSVEDRWGRPGPDGGPLYVLEMKPSGAALTFYWARIPMERRGEFGGESRAYWRGEDAHLEACRSCHATGMADPGQRSRWRAKRILPEAKD